MNKKNNRNMVLGGIIRLDRELDRLLGWSMLFSCLQVAARICYTGRSSYYFLVWNLFLAWIPYLMTAHGRTRSCRTGTLAWFILYFLGWLFCIPNAFYIITDLFHLSDFYSDNAAPAWYDLVMILSFAWNGLILGFLSVHQMQRIIRRRWPAARESYFLYPVMGLNALGIYTGRYLRFNSWDVLMNPFKLMANLTSILLHPLAYRNAWGMMLSFSVLLTLIYLMLQKIGRAMPG